MQTFIKSSRVAAIGIIAGLLSVTGPALAADNTTMAVSASVTNACDVVSTGLTFAAYSPLSGANVDATATVTVTCTTGAAASVRLDDGAHEDTGSSAATPVRRMQSAADVTKHLGYQLYKNNTHTTVWGGDAATGANHTGTGSATALTVYGRIPMSQPNVTAAADYADTVAVLVVF